MREVSSWHVGVSAEAFAAAVFARYGYDVSVQYGANQPEYDLMVSSGDNMLKISVKGSKDGGWVLTAGKKKGRTYHEAVDEWLEAHHRKTIFCLVQFKGVAPDEMPRIYLASPEEIAERLKASAGGRGDSSLHENHTWRSSAAGRGTTDKEPENWEISEKRIDEMFGLYGK